jgi:hypothetical protein
MPAVVGTIYASTARRYSISPYGLTIRVFAAQSGHPRSSSARPVIQAVESHSFSPGDRCHFDHIWIVVWHRCPVPRSDHSRRAQGPVYSCKSSGSLTRLQRFTPLQLRSER